MDKRQFINYLLDNHSKLELANMYYDCHEREQELRKEKRRNKKKELKGARSL